MNIEVPQEQIEAFCRKWKIREFALFGSVLRDDFRPDSDVDVLVEFEPGSKRRIADWLAIQDELKRMFGREVEVVQKGLIENPFRRRHILASQRVLYAA